MIRVLFVCTGNICRSPTAEGVLRLAADQSGVAVEVESAGTHGYHIGDPADRRAIELAKSKGVDIASHRARQVNTDDFQAFDHILALDHGHLQILQAMQPEGARARLSLLMEHAPGRNETEVPDPYYGDMSDYENAYDLIRDAVEAFLTGTNDTHA